MANGEEEEQEAKETSIWSMEEKKNKEGKGEKHLEKENIWSSEEKKNGDGKGAKYLEKENVWRKKIFGEGKYLEKENFWRRKIAYLIIVTDATDAVSVNFSGQCKFLQI